MDLNDPTTVTLLATDAFDAAGLAHAVYGGLLTAVYGEPRETRDADFAVIDVSAVRAREALAAASIQVLVTFEEVAFGGLTLSRLTLLGVTAATGLNTVDLVRPRSARYAALAIDRAVTSAMRGQSIKVLALEDYILFKVMSTRDRDLEDARAAMRRSGALLDLAAVDREVETLSHELPDLDVRSRWAGVRTRDWIS